MASLGDGILQDLVAALVTFLLGVSAGAIARALLSRRASNLLLALPPGPVHVVLGSPFHMKPGGTRAVTATVPVAAAGTVLGYGRIADLVRRQRPDVPVSVFFSASFPADLLADNLVLLGFPKTNEVTRDVVRHLDLPVDIQDHRWTERATGRVFEATLAGDYIVEDHGSVIRAPNPYNENSVVHVFAGTQTYGLKAAIEFLRSENLGLILKATPSPPSRPWSPLRLADLLVDANGAFYQLVLATRVRDHYTSPATVVARHTLSSS